MTEKTPDTLERLWDDIPTGTPPIAEMLSAGHAAHRRKRRMVIAGAAAATALVLGGGALLTQGGNATQEPIAAAPDLTVDITYSPSAEATALNVTTGHAEWNDTDNTLIYVSAFNWSGSCPPEGTAALSGDRVTLELRQPDNGTGSCTMDARSVTAIINGLDDRPDDIEVTDGSEHFTVTVDDDSGPASELTVRTTLEGPRVFYVEGALTEVTVTRESDPDASPETPLAAPAPAGWSHTWTDLSAGRYHLVAAVRPCGGNCDGLDPATDSCERSIDLTTSTQVLVTFRYGQPCYVTVTAVDNSSV
jgi:hypothetical protein